MKRCAICDGKAFTPRSIFCGPCLMVYNSKKDRAASLISSNIAAGILPPAKTLKCVDCGKQAYCYDHRDYLKPFDISPVCSGCNKRRGMATINGIFSIPLREDYLTKKSFETHLKIYEAWKSEIYRNPQFLLGLERIDGVELHRSRK